MTGMLRKWETIITMLTKKSKSNIKSKNPYLGIDEEVLYTGNHPFPLMHGNR